MTKRKSFMPRRAAAPTCPECMNSDPDSILDNGHGFNSSLLVLTCEVCGERWTPKTLSHKEQGK